MDVNISGNKVFKTQSGFFPDGFLYSSSHKQVASANKEKTDDENQIVISENAIRDCCYANHAYKNDESFVCKYICYNVQCHTGLRINNISKLDRHKM